MTLREGHEAPPTPEWPRNDAPGDNTPKPDRFRVLSGGGTGGAGGGADGVRADGLFILAYTDSAFYGARFWPEAIHRKLEYSLHWYYTTRPEDTHGNLTSYALTVTAASESHDN